MKKQIILITVMLLLVAIIITAFGFFYTIYEDQYACIVRFSKIVAVNDQPGLHTKTPFIDSVKYFPKNIQLYDIPPSEVLTSDKKNMTVDSYVLWKIEDPLLFYSALSTMSAAEERLNAITYNALKNSMGTLEQNAIINQNEGANRNDLYERITADVASICTNYGIRVVDVKVKRLDLPADNEQAVFNRMISERNQIAEKYIADGQYEASIIHNDVDKKVNITVSDAQAKAATLEAEGESEYMKMLGNAYDTEDKREFFEFIKALEALKASLKGGEKTVIAGKDSVLGKLLLGP